MIGLKELVDGISSNTFDPQEIPSADVFLAKHENKTLIEHLLPKILDNPSLFKSTLLRYIVLMQAQTNVLNTHRLALEKYIRTACRYIIVNHDLDTIVRVNEALTNYFPKDDPALHTIFLRTSYRILLGRLFGNINTIQTIMDGAVKMQTVRSMAQHRLYSTHQNDMVRSLNYFTSGMMKVSGVASLFNNETITTFMAPMTETYDYYTSTTRTQQLSVYAKLITSIPMKGTEITTLTENDKKAHIDLLSFLYFEGNEALQNEIVMHIDKIIEAFPEDIPLHAHILETFAPDPLGKMAYGMHAHSSNILGALKSESYLKLFRACPHLLKDETDIEYFGIALDKVINGFPPFTQELSFHPNTPASTRWLAYLMCMRDYPKVTRVVIHVDNVTMDDNMLLSYLMGSSKLELTSSNPTSLATVSPLSIRCTITYDNDNLPVKTKQINTYTDNEICDILNSKEIFKDADHPLLYHIMTSKSIEIDFMISKTAVIPGEHSTGNENACKELLRLMIMAFPATWGQLPGHDDQWKRPCVVYENRNINKVHCSALKHKQPEWIIVINDNNRFLFDINIEPTCVEKGFFSMKGHGKEEALRDHFPDLAATFLPSRGRSYSQGDAKSPKSSKDRSLSPSHQ